jgi:hypothetical protein
LIDAAGNNGAQVAALIEDVEAEYNAEFPDRGRLSAAAAKIFDLAGPRRPDGSMSLPPLEAVVQPPDEIAALAWRKVYHFGGIDCPVP